MKKIIVCGLAAMIVGGTNAIHAQQEMLNIHNGKAIRHIAFDLEKVTVSYKDGSQVENVQKAQFAFPSEVVGIRETAATEASARTEMFDLQGLRISQSSTLRSAEGRLQNKNPQHSACPKDAYKARTLNAQPRRGIFLVKNGNKTTLRINK